MIHRLHPRRTTTTPEQLLVGEALADLEIALERAERARMRAVEAVGELKPHTQPIAMAAVNKILGIKVE